VLHSNLSDVALNVVVTPVVADRRVAVVRTSPIDIMACGLI